jgi:hypothetical protein
MMKNSDVDLEELERQIDVFGKACQKMADEIVKRVMPSLEKVHSAFAEFGKQVLLQCQHVLDFVALLTMWIDTLRSWWDVPSYEVLTVSLP